ncbi:PREDICTED: homeobox protein CDX-2 isoform X1 [Papilio xuthus]|uniref:Homeobox protein CDX-2 isoform X1 n=1 Tax=Papilio xuthus TaxID=66420 RepID=A0AAJ6ZLA8_PAPXU|nr:PREDICTED: homeobox protein CDX-2 isoform X1 [Papilio xuthus]
MVNYVNPLAMYQGKGGQYGAGGWYGWQHQNYEEQQWSAWNAAPAGEWPAEPHHFPKREPGERDVGEMPSPARGDLASPGESSPGSRPSQPAHPPHPPGPPRSPYEWMKKPNYQTQPNPGFYFTSKTRTKDKYRVVYTDHQRLELEKEFHYSRYITIRRKAELAASLGLSERQVKIWFQNRRAKERKQVKKREEVVMKEKGDHASLQHAQLHHATMLHHQQMMNGMMHHHHYHQGVLQGVPEPLVPGVPPVPLL